MLNFRFRHLQHSIQWMYTDLSTAHQQLQQTASYVTPGAKSACLGSKTKCGTLLHASLYFQETKLTSYPRLQLRYTLGAVFPLFTVQSKFFFLTSFHYKSRLCGLTTSSVRIPRNRLGNQPPRLLIHRYVADTFYILQIWACYSRKESLSSCIVTYLYWLKYNGQAVAFFFLYRGIICRRGNGISVNYR